MRAAQKHIERRNPSRVIPVVQKRSEKVKKTERTKNADTETDRQKGDRETKEKVFVGKYRI